MLITGTNYHFGIDLVTFHLCRREENKVYVFQDIGAVVKVFRALAHIQLFSTQIFHAKLA